MTRRAMSCLIAILASITVKIGREIGNGFHRSITLILLNVDYVFSIICSQKYNSNLPEGSSDIN